MRGYWFKRKPLRLELNALDISGREEGIETQRVEEINLYYFTFTHNTRRSTAKTAKLNIIKYIKFTAK